MNETCITFFCLIYYIIYKAYIILFMLLMYTKKLYNLIIFSYLFHILLFIIVKAFAFFFFITKETSSWDKLPTSHFEAYIAWSINWPTSNLLIETNIKWRLCLIRGNIAFLFDKTLFQFVALSWRWITGSVFINEETFHFAETELSEKVFVLKIIEKRYFLVLYQWNEYLDRLYLKLLSSILQFFIYCTIKNKHWKT